MLPDMLVFAAAPITLLIDLAVVEHATCCRAMPCRDVHTLGCAYTHAMVPIFH